MILHMHFVGPSRFLRVPGSFWTSLLGVILLISVVSCASPLARAQSGQPPATEAVTPALRKLLAANEPLNLDARPLDLAALRRFYGARGFRPAWTADPAAQQQAVLALMALDHASDEGLDPADYYARSLVTGPPPTAKAVAERDLLLTDGFLRYAHDLRLGRIVPDEVYDDIRLPAQSFDAVGALETSLRNGSLAELIAELPPPHREYARLREALARYRALLAKGGWPKLPAEFELKLGSNDPRLAVLRQRFAIEDPALAAAPDTDDLAEALRRYQARNGLEVDGRIGRRTLAMLNVSAAERVDQIIANMERWRWLPRALEAHHVAVNVASGELTAVKNGKPVLTSRVIVGDQKHPTPILRTLVAAVTVNPPWNVPPSIARKEILPKLRRNPSYLLSEKIMLMNGPTDDPYGLKIDWHAVSASRFPYRLRQLPGPGNALGVIKLEMPNQFDVYLHDTPARRLFARAERSLSHGCIRVEEILALASFALTGDTTKASEEIRKAIASGTTRHLGTARSLSVYLLYWTAIANADGVVEFRPDIYGRDTRLSAALTGRSASSAVALRSTACRSQNS